MVKSQIYNSNKQQIEHIAHGTLYSHIAVTVLPIPTIEPAGSTVHTSAQQVHTVECQAAEQVQWSRSTRVEEAVSEKPRKRSRLVA
jgi:hypothetical protein